MDLGYLNARVHGSKGTLLTPEDFNRLSSAKDSHSLASLLGTTRYGPAIELARAAMAGAGDTGASISIALRAELEGSLSALWRAAPEEARALLRAVLSPFELLSLKTVIRGIERAVPRDEILGNTLAIGELDLTALKELSALKDFGEVLRKLKTWGSPYAGPLSRVLKEYSRTKSLATIELALDRYAITHWFKGLSSGSTNNAIIRDALRDRADSANIMTLLKLAAEAPARITPQTATTETRGGTRGGAETGTRAGAGAENKDLFIDSGKRLSKEAFTRLLAIDTREELLSALPEELGDSKWGEAVLYGEVGPGGALTLEENLEHLTGLALIRRAMVEPLSIAPSAAYIYHLVREIKNLRLVLRGAVFKIPEGSLRELLLFYTIPFDPAQRYKHPSNGHVNTTKDASV